MQVAKDRLLIALHSPFTRDVAQACPPFLLSRLLLVLVGLFSFYFEPSPNYPDPAAVERGWHYTPSRVFDMWARYDSGWYQSIIYSGYQLRGELATTQSNIAFYPLYPMLVKLIANLTPAPGNYLVVACGVMLSNLFFLASLILLKRLNAALGLSAEASEKSLWYISFFPTSFFFSSFYTESLFLMLCLGTFLAAFKEKWLLAGLLGFLLALTRPTGVLAVFSLAIIYMENRRWAWRQVKWNILLIGLIPLGLLTFLFSLLPLTGSLVAPFQVQTSWLKQFQMPWQVLFGSTGTLPFITAVDRILVLIFLGLSVFSLVKFQSKSLGIFCLLSIGIFLFNSLISASRYVVVLFPVFSLLGMLAKDRRVDIAILITSSAFLAILMTAWVRFYWVG